MKNLLFIGLRSYLVRADGTKYYTGGIDKLSDVFLRYLKDKYNVYYLYHSGNDKTTDSYKNNYPDIKDIGIIDTEINISEYISKNNIDLVLISSWLDDREGRETDSNNSLGIVKAITNVFSKSDIPVVIYNHGTNCCSSTVYAKSISNSPNIRVINCTKHEEDLCIKLGIPPERLIRINNPIDIDNKYINHDYTLNNKFVTISRMIVGKGIPNSMEITTRVGKCLDIIGKKYRGYVTRQLANLYPGDNKYNCLGVLQRDDLLSRLSHYDLFILLPNEAEGMNLSVLEANALGVPVVVWNDWAFPDFLDHDFNIFLDHNKDTYIEQFMTEYLPKIDYYLDPSNRKILSQRTIEKFGIDNYIKTMFSILGE